MEKWIPCPSSVPHTLQVSVFGVFLVRIFPYSARMPENADHKNSKYGHVLRSDTVCCYTETESVVSG